MTTKKFPEDMITKYFQKMYYFMSFVFLQVIFYRSVVTLMMHA